MTVHPVCSNSILRMLGRFHALTLLLLATDGNAETNNDDDGAGTMECIYFGTWNATRSGWCGGSGPGPWVMADLENGLWACDKPRTVYPKNIPPTGAFVTAMVKGDSRNHWSIKAGDGQAGRLSTMFDGERPAGYHPMRKQGAILLGKRLPEFARLDPGSCAPDALSRRQAERAETFLGVCPHRNWRR